MSKEVEGWKQCDVQNAKLPEMIPFAIAGGKSACARRVIGVDSAANSAGGITRRNLHVPT